jgi:5-methyltetrahydrofolate--homocysteine methyltransferase
MTRLEELAGSVGQGDVNKAKELTRAALEEGLEAARILNEGLVRGLEEIGACFRRGEVYVPEVLLAARAMRSGLEILEPHLFSANMKSPGKVILGTVKGDLHDIGKNIVGIMLRGAGFEVVDLGVDVAPSKFVEVARETHAQVVGMSALLTTSLPFMEETIKALKEARLEKIKTIVGGAAANPSHAGMIGAGGYAPDAVAAVEKIRALLGG